MHSLTPLAIVTGASRGLGRLVASALAASGAKVLLVARDRAALDAAADEIPGAQVLELDIAAANAPQQIAAAAEAAGGADILVNNAAVQGPIGPLISADWSAIEHTLRVDLLAPMALIHALAPQMARKGAGWIVNISGGGATGPRPMFIPYGAAKTAIVRVSETLAVELAGLGVRVNAIAPGAFSSGMTRETMAAGESAGPAEAQTAQRMIANSDDAAARKAAELIAYLTLGAGRDITGRLISAVWDPWPRLHEHAGELAGSDIYTLRRITESDRNMVWSK
jgi:3-oxoacyl-[acyl-carrier protein] reductase